MQIILLASGAAADGAYPLDRRDRALLRPGTRGPLATALGETRDVTSSRAAPESVPVL